jgi:hypothetical protein
MLGDGVHSGRTGDKSVYTMPKEGKEKDLIRLSEGFGDDSMLALT